MEVDDKELLIVTDLEKEAELISLIYRYRWQVELFFKWLKCILKCRHSNLYRLDSSAPFTRIDRQTPEQASNGNDPVTSDRVPES